MAKTKAKPESGCTPNGKSCPGMALALKGGGERAIGFYWATMMDMAKGSFSSALAYRFPKKVNGASYLLVNNCPWCGAKVRAPTLQPEGESKPKEPLP